MGKSDKLLSKFLAAKGQFKWVELVSLLNGLGFEQIEGAGSRVCFTNDNLNIRLHRPHPHKEVKAYIIIQVRDILIAEGLI